MGRAPKAPMPVRTLLLACGLAALHCGGDGSGTASYTGPVRTIFDNGTEGAVAGGPPHRTLFLADRDYKVTRIATFHWNGGTGQDPLQVSGSVQLVDSQGTVLGPFAVTSPAPGFWWEAAPDVVVPAGLYQVVDSDPGTWSFDPAGDGQGIAVIQGVEPDDDRSPAVEGVAAKELPPSSDDRTMTLGDLAVTVPGGLLSRTETLEVGTVPAPSPADGDLFRIVRAWSVTLGALHDLRSPVTVEIPYDDADAASGRPPEQALLGMLFDPVSRTWVPLPTQVDTARKVLVVATDHLSEIAKAEYLGPGVLSNRTFLVTFDPAEVEAGTGDKVGWYTRFDPLATERWPEVPDYVEDVWFHLNQAARAYAEAGFPPLPQGSPEGWTGAVFSHPTNVFVGGAGSAGRSKMTKRLTFTLDCASHFEILRRTVAHEVFHAVQGQTYTMMGMMMRKWWMEATAEYASGRVAWGKVAGMGGELLHPGFLEKPLDYAATLLDAALTESPHNHHEYNSAFFIDFLVSRKGISFREMWDEVGRSYDTDVRVPLDAFLRAKLGPLEGLDFVFLEFAEHWLFGADSPVRGQLVGGGLKAVAQDGVPEPVPLKQALVTTLGQAQEYAAYVMRVPFEVGGAGVRKLKVGVGMGQPGMTAVAYAVTGDSADQARRLGELDWRQPPDTWLSCDLRTGEVLYLVLANGGRNGTQMFAVALQTEEAQATRTLSFGATRQETVPKNEMRPWPDGGGKPFPRDLAFRFSTSGTVTVPVRGEVEPKLVPLGDVDDGRYRLVTPVPDGEVRVGGSATYTVEPSEFQDMGADGDAFYDAYALKERRIVFDDKVEGNTTHTSVRPEGSFEMSVSKMPANVQANGGCQNASVQVEFDFERVTYQKLDDGEVTRTTITYRLPTGPFGIAVCAL